MEICKLVINYQKWLYWKQDLITEYPQIANKLITVVQKICNLGYIDDANMNVLIPCIKIDENEMMDMIYAKIKQV